VVVAIPSNVYFRAYGPNGYLFNRRDWTSAYIADVLPFKCLFSRHPINLDVAIKRISKECGVAESVVQGDVAELIRSLEGVGYVVCRERVELTEVRRTKRACEKFSGNDEAINNQVDQREEATHLLNEYFLEHPTPFEICIDLTRACTERCVHCYVPGFQNVFLPYEIVEKVLAEFASMGGLKVKLTGGECMLHRDFERIISLARAHDMVISVLSNLTCCDEAKARVMKDAGVAVVQASLYGMTPETHETVTRVKGSLEKTMRGIDCLRSSGVPVQIHCPVLKQNVSGIDAVAQFGRKMGMKTTFDAVMMSRADHGRTDECGLSDAELKRFIQTHEDLSDVSVACPDVDPDARVCEVGTAKICLSAEGKYYPCNGCYGYELGDCRRQTLAGVWNDEPIKQLRKLRMRDLPACAVCKNRAFCAPCPARNFNANSHVSLPDQAMCRAAACRRELVECANERS